jgi:glyoxylase-like metal-dependent hydrolase (beta-lactamase superfamily II)
MSFLPPPQNNQNYVTVSPIPGGFITLSDHFFVHPAEHGAKRTVPSLAFLIQHPGHVTPSIGSPTRDAYPINMMFDLGLRKAQARYPKVLQKHIDGRAPFKLEPGVAAQLQAGGLSPNQIDIVMLSHVHYDHHGDPEDFPHARFLIGNGALKVLKHGLGGLASHQHFEPDTLPDDRTEELPPPTATGSWRQLGPFPAVLDLFEDGSVFVIDTPGHLPGHVNLLCRTKERWILLCGDAFHDRRLLTGEKEIGTWEGLDGGMLCIHLDKEVARESIRRLRVFDEGTGDDCELIAAHEEVWWEKHKHLAFPGRL